MPADPERGGRGRRVLVVEDEARLRSVLVRAAREMEFEVEAVAAAEPAVDALDAGEFDIVLTDLNLPGMQGIELCAGIRGRWPDTQIIILTGYGDLDAARTAIRLDVVDFLTKPCSLGELEAALDRALRKRLDRLEQRPAPSRARIPAAPPPPEGAPTHRLDAVEREHIRAALEKHAGNRTAAAAELGISVRTLYYRLSQYERDRVTRERLEEERAG